MKNVNSKSLLWIVLCIALAVFVVNHFYYDKQITLSYLFNYLTSSVSLITILAIVFNRYLWKISIFHKWFVLVPNLNGKWEGNISSNWKNLEQPQQVKTFLSIKQSLSYISCVMTTEEMKSRSITTDFKMDTDNQKLELSYIYMSEPELNFREKSPIHYGAIIFDIIKSGNDIIQLKGNYWTDRKSNGTIILDKISK
ncbi:MAG: hypothetical protein LBL16_05505 [Endomicrobium sp.]|jgi:hypothetical protein|nr:hypothetical protein [Endomicrobium sp.]